MSSPCFYCAKTLYFPGRRDEEITWVVVCDDCEYLHEKDQRKPAICKECKMEKEVRQLTFDICHQCIEKYRHCSKCYEVLISAITDAAKQLRNGEAKSTCLKCEMLVLPGILLGRSD